MPYATAYPLAPIAYWAKSPDSGPDGFGFRTGITLLFPK